MTGAFVEVGVMSKRGPPSERLDMAPFNDPFDDAANKDRPDDLQDPKTPSKNGVFQMHTPSRDPFAGIPSPTHLRIVLVESERMRFHLQQELATALKETASAKKELTAAKEQIEMRDSRLSTLQKEVDGLKNLVARQEITIKNQSQTIQDPRSLRQRRFDGNMGYWNGASTQHWSVPPLSVNSITNAVQSMSLWGAQKQVMTPETPMFANHSLDGTVAGARLQGLFQPTSLNPVNMYGQNASHLVTNASPPAIDPNAAFDFEVKGASLSRKFAALWDLTQDFGKHHAMRDGLSPEQLSASVKEYMMLDPHLETAMRSLNHPKKKPFYIAKVINVFCFKKLLTCTEIVKGLDENVDSEILTARRSLTHDKPISVRSMALMKIAEQISLAQSRPNFAEFCSKMRATHSSELLHMLKPYLIMYDESQVREAICKIMLHAQDIGLELYNSPYDVIFHFPEPNESFDPTLMVNFDTTPTVKLITAKVEMSINPSIRIGLLQGEAMKVRTISHAKVFTVNSDGMNEANDLLHH